MLRHTFFLTVIVALGSCAVNSVSSEYQSNLQTAKAIMKAHIESDYDTWLSHHHPDAEIWSAEYGSQKMTPAEAAADFATHHLAFADIQTKNEVWLPGVDTLSLQADGSVRAYINWRATSTATGETIDLRAYHYFNFTDGKVSQSGNFYDAGGLGLAAQPVTTTLAFSHDVEEYDRWAAAWAEGSENVQSFQEMGVSARIFQSTDEKHPEQVTILFDIADMEAWASYQGTEEMTSNAKRHGVIFEGLKAYAEK